MGNEECLFLPIDVPVVEVREKSPASSKAQTIKDIDEKCVASHCKKLNRMIPGGVRICGICTVASLSDFTANQTHIKKILCNFPKDDAILDVIRSPRDDEKIVLLIDPETKKLSCKILNVGGDDMSFRNVSVKERPMIGAWKAFKTYINLSLETTLPADRKKEKILRQLQTAVEPYLNALLSDTNLLVDGELRDETAPIVKAHVDSSTLRSADQKPVRKSKRRLAGLNDTSSGTVGDGDGGSTKGKAEVIGRRSKRQKPLNDTDADRSSWVDVDLTIFGPQFPQWQRASSCSSLESGTSSDASTNEGTETTESSTNDFVPINRLLINGRIPGIAFLPTTATVGSLLQSLRKDLVQSILARLQLLTDELHITSAELEVPRMLLPQRVLVRLPACPSLPLSDYKFLSETADDVVSRLHYFCVPIGAQGAGDTSESDLVRPSLSESVVSSETDGRSYPPILSARDRIDASCLDTSLERSPEGSADEFSESEILDAVAQNSQPISHLTSYNPKLIVVTVLVVILAVCFYFLFVRL